MEDGVRLFQALPSLGMLSARAGFDEVLSWQMESPYRNARTWGAAPYKPLEHAVRVSNANGSSEELPFGFAPGVDNGPLLYRRAALLRIGGFDESYSCAAGHLSGHYDFEASLRFWIRGWQVGVYYGCAANGLGGRKTMRHPNARKERHSNELWNGQRIEALWRRHNATITRRLAESRGLPQRLSLPAGQREAARSAREARIGRLSKDARSCYGGLERPQRGLQARPRRARGA